MEILTIILGLLPGFTWLLFYLQEDLHPEPKKLLALTYLAGAASAFFALAVQLLLQSVFHWNIETLTLTPLLVLSFIEEATKFGAAYLVVHKNPAFDEPVDAMIYMVVAALGFATAENIGAVSGGAQGQLAILSSVFTVSIIRLVGATLLHSVTSGIVGYWWAMGIRKFLSKSYIIIGVAIATVLHGIFNYFIIVFGRNVMYSLAFAITLAFFVLADFEKLKKEAV